MELSMKATNVEESEEWTLAWMRSERKDGREIPHEDTGNETVMKDQSKL